MEYEQTICSYHFAMSIFIYYSAPGPHKLYSETQGSNSPQYPCPFPSKIFNPGLTWHKVGAATS